MMTVSEAKGADMSPWICVECGYESDERWLMCPECTTDADWEEVRLDVERVLSEAREAVNKAKDDR
jgi:predicted ATP-dependent serine protease